VSRIKQEPLFAEYTRKRNRQPPLEPAYGDVVLRGGFLLRHTIRNILKEIKYVHELEISWRVTRSGIFRRDYYVSGTEQALLCAEEATQVSGGTIYVPYKRRGRLVDILPDEETDDKVHLRFPPFV